jgi:heavy metal translocating P-type ATPase
MVASVVGASGAAGVSWLVAASLGLAGAGAGAVRSLRARRPGVDVVAVLALGGAVVVGEWAAAAVIAVMVASGASLEAWAAGRAERDLRALVERVPREAHRHGPDGVETVGLDEVRPGDRLLVRAGDAVPVDGRLDAAHAVLDASALTGESLPVSVERNELVRSGTVNVGDAFDLRSVATAADSAYAAVVRLVAHAQEARPPFVRLADRLALVFVPVVLAAVAATWWISGSAVRAVAVLVVATPCPLILAAPVALVSGLSRAARRGLLVKDAGVLERLATGRVLVLDKTGTVTEGRPAVVEVAAAPDGDAAGSPDEVLRLAATLEQVSSHVLASAVVRAATARDAGGALGWPTDVHETTGAGVAGRVEGRAVRVGRLDWLLAGASPPEWSLPLRRRAAIDAALTLFVEVDGRVAGALLLEDPLRRDASGAIRALRAVGIDWVVLATGDRPGTAEAVGALLGVDEVLAQQSPGQKVAAVTAARRRGPTVMVGDGVNDAPALTAADVGVALGSTAAEASAELADVVLAVDRLDRLVDGIAVARRAVGIARQSVVAGMALSFGGMGLAAFGLLPPLAGAVVQELIDVAVILNALRVLTWRPRRPTLPPAEAELGRSLAAEHTELAAGLADLRALADDIDGLPAGEVVDRLEAARRFLVEQLLVHETADERRLYPAVSRALGGFDPTGAMSRAHTEIAALVRTLGAVVDDLVASGCPPERRREARRLLYGLDAVSRVHFAQEEEYLALAEEADVAPGTDSSRR